ncbi:unnamed protein product [Effrenium voratum]|nr:unnamed protein product [Effrenium voratum]
MADYDAALTSSDEEARSQGEASGSFTQGGAQSGSSTSKPGTSSTGRASIAAERGGGKALKLSRAARFMWQLQGDQSQFCSFATVSVVPSVGWMFIQLPARSAVPHAPLQRSSARRRWFSEAKPRATRSSAGFGCLAAAAAAARSLRTACRAEAPAAEWHKARRKAILRRYPELGELRGSDARTLPLLVFANAAQLGLACFAGFSLQTSDNEALSLCGVAALAVAAGGTLSLCSFSVLHDLLHGTCLRGDRTTREQLLFWLSFPTIFGYHLYLQRGHLSHHRNLGRASMGQLFESQRLNFEDGDVLFVAHRQPLQGQPFEVALPFTDLRVSPSISHNVLTRLWDRSKGQSPDARAVRNGALYCFSMIFERCALAVNDKIVALFGRNAFFLQKPAAFHDSCAKYARVAAVLQVLLYMYCGPGALLYLLIAEVAWQLPIHPGCAMFVSNHGSARTADGGCAPTSSLYVDEPWGWFDWVCMFSNYHLEHHDFPDVPLLKLPELRTRAPEFYGLPSKAERVPSNLAVATPAATNWLATVHRSFAEPEPYV